MRFFLIFSVIGCLVVFPLPSQAKTYTHVVKQSFGGSQSPDDARTAAIAKAKREVLELAGTYLESLTVVKDFAVEKDEIHALAAGVLKARVVSQKNYATEDGFGVVVTARVDVDQGVMEKRLKKYLEDRDALARLEAARKREKELLVTIRELENRNQALAGQAGKEKEKKALKADFKVATQGLNALELASRAQELRRAGELEKALKTIDQAIALSPETGLLYNDRAVILRDMGKFGQAFAAIDKAIALEPGNPGFFNIKGRIYAKQDNWGQAIDAYSRAIELAPKSFLYYYNRGLMYNRLGPAKKAVSDFDKAIALYPGDSRLYLSRGLAHTYDDQYEKAVADFTEAIRLDPNYGKAYNSRGIAFSRMGRDDQALADFTKGLEFNPSNVKLRYNRLQVLEKKGDCEAIISEYRAIGKAAPDHFLPVNGLAWALATSRKKSCRNGKEALKLAKKALKMKNDCRIMCTLAAAHAETGDFIKAVSWQTKANALCEEKDIYVPDRRNYLEAYQQGRAWRE